MKEFEDYKLSSAETIAMQLLEDLCGTVKAINPNNNTSSPPQPNLQPLGYTSPLKSLSLLIKDVMYHIEVLGIFGATKALIAYTIVMERLKRSCDEIAMFNLYDTVITILSVIKMIFEQEMASFSKKDKVFKFSSDQILQLIDILRDFKTRSQQELCGIVFVERRFTAKILYHVLKELSKIEEFNYIKPEFIVGFQSNPYNPTREGLFVAKQNKKILAAFREKQVNLIVSTNVLEEGIDMPNCSLIIKFDKPTNYRSYVQSKGRARHCKSFYYIMVAKSKITNFMRQYHQFQEVEDILNKVSTHVFMLLCSVVHLLQFCI